MVEYNTIKYNTCDVLYFIKYMCVRIVYVFVCIYKYHGHVRTHEEIYDTCECLGIIFVH